MDKIQGNVNHVNLIIFFIADSTKLKLATQTIAALQKILQQRT